MFIYIWAVLQDCVRLIEPQQPEIQTDSRIYVHVGRAQYKLLDAPVLI